MHYLLNANLVLNFPLQPKRNKNEIRISLRINFPLKPKQTGVQLNATELW